MCVVHVFTIPKYFWIEKQFSKNENSLKDETIYPSIKKYNCNKSKFCLLLGFFLSISFYQRLLLLTELNRFIYDKFIKN